jgi:hypothetical protein
MMDAEVPVTTRRCVILARAQKNVYWILVFTKYDDSPDTRVTLIMFDSPRSSFIIHH